MGGRVPVVRATRLKRWSNIAMPGNITPSLGSTGSAISAICEGTQWRFEGIGRHIVLAENEQPDGPGTQRGCRGHAQPHLAAYHNPGGC